MPNSKNPNIVAVKESSGNCNRALALVQVNSRDFEMICGSDDLAVDFLFWGVRGWISGGANVFPGEQAAMAAAAAQGKWDEAKALMAGMYPVIQAMESGDYRQKAKMGCRRHGVDAGGSRLPLSPFTDAVAEAYIALLAAHGK